MMAPHCRESTDWQVNYPEIKMRSAHILRSKEWTDCTFRFERDTGDETQSVESTVEAHRLILAMASPVFAAMFFGNVGDIKGPVFISDIDFEIFKKMLDYIYTDEVDIKSAKIAMDLYIAANKYFLVHLEKRCIDYLSAKLNSNNACYVYEFSCLYKEDRLKQKCLKMFSTETNNVLFGSSFNNAKVDTLKTIYSMDSLSLENELELLRALVSYTKAQPVEIDTETNMVKDENETSEETKDLDTVDSDCVCDCDRDEGKVAVKKRVMARRKMIPGVIEKIRFLTVSANEFASCQFLSELLTNNEILYLLMNITTKLTPIPMPRGFSTSVIRRVQKELFHEHCTLWHRNSESTGFEWINPNDEGVMKIIHDPHKNTYKLLLQNVERTVFAMWITMNMEAKYIGSNDFLTWKGVNLMMNPQSMQTFVAKFDSDDVTKKFKNKLEDCIDVLKAAVAAAVPHV